MRFLTKLFGGGGQVEGPDITFGRYTDLYKPDHKFDTRKRAHELFVEGQYQASFAAFFDYLTDERRENVRTYTDDKGLHFEILQGSKLIKGTIGPEMIHAEARVARARALPIGFLRRMMELNYMLKYSRYALDPEDNLTVLFDSYLLDGSPLKTYHALKEIAVSADKQDDLLLAEFDSLEPVNTGHTAPLPEKEKDVKTAFIRSRISSVLARLDDGLLRQEKYTEGVIYLLLDLNYRLDYLISPEGRIKEIFERVHLTLFAQDERSAAERILLARNAFEEILGMSDEEMHAEMYRVTSSFGMTAPGSQEQLVASIEGTLGNMDWFVEHQQKEIALAIPGFIAGYGLFNYAYPPPLYDLLHLYYYITEPAFFSALGFTPELYDTKRGLLDKRGIRSALSDIEQQYKRRYPRLTINGKDLDFSSLAIFVKAYFTMLKTVDLAKKT